jgi:hypothetical protein
MGFGHKKLDTPCVRTNHNSQSESIPIPIPTPTPMGTRSRRIHNNWLQATAKRVGWALPTTGFGNLCHLVGGAHPTTPAHPWGLDIFSIQDKRVPIAVGIIIGVGVGIGIGIGIEGQKMGFGHKKLDTPCVRTNHNSQSESIPIPIPTPTPMGTRSRRILNNWLQATAKRVGWALPTTGVWKFVPFGGRCPPYDPCPPLGFGHFFNTGQTRPDRGRDYNRCRGRYRNRNRNRRTKDGIWTQETGYTVREDQPQFTVGIDPDPDPDPDTDGNQEQTDPQQLAPGDG